eukprot:TCONS_00051608-protein
MDIYNFIYVVILIFNVLLPNDGVRAERSCTIKEKRLDCTKLNMTVFESTIFPTNIEHIVLDNNKLTEFPNLEKFPNLKSISISHNLLTSLKNFGSFLHLELLNLSHNQLENLDGLFNSTLTKLQKLFISHNQLEKIDKIFQSSFPNLQSLDASHNKIKQLIGSRRRSRSLFPNLKYLALNNNEVSYVKYFFDHLSSTETIILSYNKLQKLTNEHFITLVQRNNLKELYLDHNLLKSIELWFRFLIKLDLSHNRLETFKNDAFYLESLTEMDLSGNKIAFPSKDLFSKTQAMARLNLSNNNIRSLSENSFMYLQNLKYLDLSTNNISVGMKEFDKVFLWLKNLKTLNIRRNKILLLPTNSFPGLGALEVLDLAGNDIKYIERNALSNLKNLVELNIDTRDLDCDCSITWFRDWLSLQTTLIKKSISGVCASPPWLRNKNAMTILDSELTCVKHNKDYTIRPKFVIQPTSKYIKIHGNVSLECVATSSVENLILINWYLDGQPVHHRKTVESKLQYVRANLYKKSSTLLLNDIRHDERGSYWCDAVNIYGSRRSKEANVTIVVPPTISKRPQPKIIKRTGDDVRLPCSAEGIPAPLISFKKITGDETAWKYATINRRIHYEKETFSFIVRDLKVEDSGFYACSASSRAGKVNATVQLVVIAKPSFIRPMKSKRVPPGTVAVLDCIISGNPRPHIQWFKDNHMLRPSKSITLSNQMMVINNFNERDVGSYSCHASNDLGSASQSARLELSQTEREQATPNVAIIAMTVIIVFTVTSFIWFMMFCYCRRKRKQEREISRAPTDDHAHLSQYKEGLVPELPKDYLLRCNGKLISPTPPVLTPAIDTVQRLSDSEPLLEHSMRRSGIAFEDDTQIDDCPEANLLMRDTLRYLREQTDAPPLGKVTTSQLQKSQIDNDYMTDEESSDQHDSGVLVHYKSGSSLCEQSLLRESRGRPYVTIDVTRDKRKESGIRYHHKHSLSVDDSSVNSNQPSSLQKRKRLTSQSNPNAREESSGIESGVSSSSESISSFKDVDALGQQNVEVL